MAKKSCGEIVKPEKSLKKAGHACDVDLSVSQPRDLKDTRPSEECVTEDSSIFDPGIPLDLAGAYLRLLGSVLNAAADNSIKRHPIGAGAGKISTLQVIAKNPGISQIEISRMFGRDRSLQFRIVTDLEKRGLIRRQVDPLEKRRHKLFATDFGLGLLPGIEKLVRDSDRQFFSSLNETEYEQLRSLLRRVLLDNVGDGASFWLLPDETPEDL